METDLENLSALVAEHRRNKKRGKFGQRFGSRSLHCAKRSDTITSRSNLNCQSGGMMPLVTVNIVNEKMEGEFDETKLHFFPSSKIPIETVERIGREKPQIEFKGVYYNVLGASANGKPYIQLEKVILGSSAKRIGRV